MGELILSTIVVSVNDKKLGIKLKQARLESGLSQEQVGAQLGVTWEMISRYENGRTSPLKHLESLANVYKKPISFFLGADEKDPESFSIDKFVARLKDEGIGFSTATKNVIKLIDHFSGRGIERDLMNSDSYYEVSTALTNNYPNAFALKINDRIDSQIKNELKDNDIAIFTPTTEANEDEIVIGYDGIKYKLMPYDPKGLDTPLAALVLIERRFKF